MRIPFDEQFSHLNDNQKKAVLTTEGPVLIIAGPGSGKTSTLVERTYHLIANLGVQPENIMLGTFTEKAAKELLTRLYIKLNKANINVNLNEMYIGTLHSIFLRMLDEHREYTRLRRNYTVMDEFEQQYFFYLKLREYDEYLSCLCSPITSRWIRAQTLMKRINQLSEELVDHHKLLKSNDSMVQALGLIYQTYLNQLEEENALDFSTIQVEAYQLFEEHPEVLEKVQSKIAYMLIDEYQDTNTVQEKVILKLCNHKNNICVVGDDDQGLYRFRGATIQNILEFPNNFAEDECEVITLDINYRSHNHIIDFYNQWMNQQNWSAEDYYGNKRTYRYEKTIRPPEDKSFVDNPAVLKVSSDEHRENWYEEIFEFISALPVDDLNQIAFLFRSVKNDKATELAAYLEARGIPVYSPRSKMFFDRPEIRLIIGGLLSVFPDYKKIFQWDDNIHLQEWNYYDECFREFMEHLRNPENKKMLNWVRVTAKRHLPLMENTDYAFSGLFYQLLQFPLFNQYLGVNAYGNVIDSRPARNLSLFSKLLTRYEYLHRISILSPDKYKDNLSYLFNQYMRFLYQGGIEEYEDDEEYAPSGCVSFYTIHQAKGMEFPVVIVDSLNSSPRKNYDDLDALLQQEYYSRRPFEPLELTKFYDFWRLYYTAFSRAQNLLVMSCAEKQGHGRTPSKHFESIYRQLIDWKNPAVDFNMIEFEKIKDVDIKKQYSFTSHVLFYEQCPRQYLYFKELDFSPVRSGAVLFGTLVHETIEDVHRAILNDEQVEISTDIVEEWFERNYTNLVKKEHVYLAPNTKQVALGQVLSYVSHQQSMKIPIQDAEVDVSLVKEKYILKGTIDLITGKDETVEIIDFKAEKKPNLEDSKKRIQQYQKQLEIYAHLVEERTGKAVSKMHLYYTGEDGGNPYVTFSKKECDIEKTIGGFDEIVNRIQQKNYDVEERPTKICAECDLRHYCDETL